MTADPASCGKLPCAGEVMGQDGIRCHSPDGHEKHQSGHDEEEDFEAAAEFRILVVHRFFLPYTASCCHTKYGQYPEVAISHAPSSVFRRIQL